MAQSSSIDQNVRFGVYSPIGDSANLAVQNEHKWLSLENAVIAFIQNLIKPFLICCAFLRQALEELLLKTSSSCDYHMWRTVEDVSVTISSLNLNGIQSYVGIPLEESCFTTNPPSTQEPEVEEETWKWRAVTISVCALKCCLDS
ncbi:hypothetical protein YC2023_064982 [Brassica napus]